MKQISLVSFILLFIQYQGFAQKIEDLSTTEVASGRVITLGDLVFDQGLIIISHSMACPFAEMYSNRLESLMDNYEAKGFSFNLLNPSRDENADLSSLKTFLSENSISVPYLSDPGQVWTKFFGITKIPEIVLITKGENGLEVAYRGAFDNNPQAEGSVTHRYFERAINQILKGEKPGPAAVRAMGCNVKTF